MGTPAPYGPLWLLLGKGVAALVGAHVAISVAAIRLIAMLGLVLLASALPRLATRAGGRADVAMWLVVANPATLILGVGGGHNDLLMIGLMSTGLVLVTRSPATWRGLVAGTIILTAAVAVKSPAVIAVAFAVPLWLRGTHGQAVRTRRRAVHAVTIVGVTSALSFTAVTLLSGLGVGWVRQANSSASVVSWMSLPSSVAILSDLMLGRGHGALKLDGAMTQFRTAGTVLSIAILIGLWALSMRESAGFVGRSLSWSWLAGRSVWQLLALAMLSVVVLGPSVQPWYFTWGLAVVAATSLGRRPVAVMAGLSLGMVAMIRPNGVGLQMNPSVLALLGLPVLLACSILAPEALSAMIENGVRVRQALARVLRGDRVGAEQRNDKRGNAGRGERPTAGTFPEQGMHPPLQVDLGGAQTGGR